MKAAIGAIILVAFGVGACAPAHVESVGHGATGTVSHAEEPLQTPWKVECIETHRTDSRQCFAGTFVASVPFTIRYFNGIGPYVTAGYHTDPTAKASVRVDNGKVHWLTNLNEYAAQITGTAHMSEARKLVRDLSSGTTAYVQYRVWPDGVPRAMDVNLSGFKEAHTLLMQKVAAAR